MRIIGILADQAEKAIVQIRDSVNGGVMVRDRIAELKVAIIESQKGM